MSRPESAEDPALASGDPEFCSLAASSDVFSASRAIFLDSDSVASLLRVCPLAVFRHRDRLAFFIHVPQVAPSPSGRFERGFVGFQLCCECIQSCPEELYRSGQLLKVLLRRIEAVLASRQVICQTDNVCPRCVDLALLGLDFALLDVNVGHFGFELPRRITQLLFFGVELSIRPFQGVSLPVDYVNGKTQGL